MLRVARAAATVGSCRCAGRQEALLRAAGVAAPGCRRCCAGGQEPRLWVAGDVDLPGRSPRTGRQETLSRVTGDVARRQEAAGHAVAGSSSRCGEQQEPKALGGSAQCRCVGDQVRRVAGVAAPGGRSHSAVRQEPPLQTVGALAVVAARDAVAGGNPRARHVQERALRVAGAVAPCGAWSPCKSPCVGRELTVRPAAGGATSCGRSSRVGEPLSGRKQGALTQRGPRSGRFQGGRGAHPGWTVGVALSRVADSYVAHRDLD